MNSDTAPNQLGRYLRNLRRDKKMTLADVSREANCSVGYSSRIEKGVVTDGPSAALLERIANVLRVDPLVLLRLAQSDKPELEEPAQQRVSSGGTARSFTDARSPSLPSARDGHRVGHKPPADMADYGGMASLPPAVVSLASVIPTLPAGEDNLIALANVYNEIGESSLRHRNTDASLAAYEFVEHLYGALGRPIDLAITQFRIARVYRAAPYTNHSISERDCLDLLYQADRYHESAYGIFIAQREELTSEQRSRFAESLVHWARTDIDISRHSAALVHQITKRLRPEQGLKTVRKPARDIRSELSAIKRDMAASMFSKLITELETDEPSLTQAQLGSKLELLAETYLRYASLYSDFEYDDDEKRHLDRYAAKYSPLFIKAIDLNKRLVRDFGSDEQARTKHLRRLVHTHSTFGNALQLGRAERQIAIDDYPKALWQYLVGQDLTTMLPEEEQQVFRVEFADKLSSLELQVPTGPRGLMRRSVTARLERNNYGTLPHLVLDYPSAWE